MTITRDDDPTAIERGDHATHDPNADDLESLERTKVGRYLLLSPLGKGAFGTVFAAYDPELDRKVAIKLVRVRSHERGEELLREAQLPAQLSHPNVVAIHDVGWAQARSGSDERALYIVMEHLGGPTLGEWLNAERRSWRAIVDVLVQAGRGLEAAHQRKLIHLDFKPGNVMFGEDGRPRVLDFGLARVLRDQRDPSESGSHTVLGTPAFMSVEQHVGEDTDARADQYAFAVTLWLALWGELPFVTEGPEWLRALVKLKYAGPPTPPRKPSVPAHVRAAVTRALAAKPEDRFADMTSLLAALTDDPAKRRRRLVYAGIGAAALVGLGYGAMNRADPCALPEDRFAGIWDEQVATELDAAFAAAKVDLADEAMALVRAGLDDQIARWTATRAQICEAGEASGAALETMSEELLCLEVHLGRIGALTQSLRTANSVTIARAGESVLGLDDPEHCLEARRGRAKRELDEDERAALLDVEALIASAKAESSLARFEPSLARADEALALARPLGDDEVLAEAHLARGVALEQLGRYDESRAALFDAMRHADLAGMPELTIQATLPLIHGLTQAGHHDQAELASELARTRADSIEDPKLALRLDAHISQLYVRQARWDEALVLAKDVLARQIELDPDDLVLNADLELSLGNVYTGSGRNLDEARAHYERARAIWLEIYGPGHPKIATVLVNLSAIDFANTDYASAREHLQAGIDAFAYTLPPTHSRFGVLYQNLTALYMVEGRYADAIEQAKRALEVHGASVGETSTHYALAESNLVATLVLEGRFAEALDHARHVVEVYANLEPTDGRRLTGLGALIESLWGLGRDAEASARIDELRTVMTEVAPDDRHQVEAIYVLAQADLRAGEYERALERCEYLMTRLDIDLIEPEPIADVAVALSETLRSLGRPEEARARLLPLLERLGGTGEDAHRATWTLRLELGEIARALGDDAAAREHFEAALRLVEGSPVPTAEVELALARLELDDAPARAKARLARVVTTLESAGVRPDLVAEAKRLREP